MVLSLTLPLVLELFPFQVLELVLDNLALVTTLLEIVVIPLLSEVTSPESIVLEDPVGSVNQSIPLFIISINSFWFKVKSNITKLLTPIFVIYIILLLFEIVGEGIVNVRFVLFAVISNFSYKSTVEDAVPIDPLVDNVNDSELGILLLFKSNPVFNADSVTARVVEVPW